MATGHIYRDKCGESVNPSNFQSAQLQLDEALKAIDRLQQSPTTSLSNRRQINDRWLVEMLDISDFISQGSTLFTAREGMESANDKGLMNGVIGRHYVHISVRLTSILEYSSTALSTIKFPALSIEMKQANSALRQIDQILKRSSCP
jgi:hypothetical protein